MKKTPLLFLAGILLALVCAGCNNTLDTSVSLNSISIDGYSTTLSVNETKTIYATKYPSSATSTIYWTSSNSSVASVEGHDTYAIITAKASGSATITAYSSDSSSVYDDYYVTVSAAPYSYGSSIPSSYWTTGTVSSSDSSIIYSFSGYSGSTYYVYWDDSGSGSGSMTGDVKVYYNVGSTDFSSASSQDNGYNTPLAISPSSSGTVYLKVVPYSSSYTGTFKICALYSDGTNKALSVYSSN